jgi:hypothetical protein
MFTTISFRKRQNKQNFAMLNRKFSDFDSPLTIAEPLKVIFTNPINSKQLYIKTTQQLNVTAKTLKFKKISAGLLLIRDH